MQRFRLNYGVVLPSNQPMSKSSFFRQSGWMVIATTAGGVFMYAVHVAAKEMPKAEYGLFTTLLQVLNQMTIPAIGLQFSFAQMTVSALANHRPAQLAGALRSVALGAFGLWLLLGAGTFFAQDYLLATYKISNPAALWVTLALALTALWSPIVMGTLQGAQNFLWLGWTSILNGVARLVAVAVIVVVLGGYAAGAMTGAVIGMVVAMAVGAWHTRPYWVWPVEPFAWLPWLKRLLPLTIGFGGVIFMMSLDMIVVRAYFPVEETGYYGAAGMIGRALYFFTAPLTAVLFPKIVHSAARSEKSNVLLQALGATALLGCAAAVFCTLFPELPLRLVYDKSFLKVAPLVPVFAWCMLPLTLSSVLINNLLAREKFGVVPWLVLAVVGYYFGLRHAAQVEPQDFARVVKMLGIFSGAMMVICLVFTWLSRGTGGATPAAVEAERPLIEPVA